MRVRVIEVDGRFYPQYYSNGFFGLFKGWCFYEDDELCLNGIFTDLTRCKRSYSRLNWAIEYLENLEYKKNIVYEK
jgi:hypothetical protein